MGGVQLAVLVVGKGGVKKTTGTGAWKLGGYKESCGTALWYRKVQTVWQAQGRKGG